MVTTVVVIGIPSTPVVSTGVGNEQIEPNIAEYVVTATTPTVEADFDLAGIVLPAESTAERVDVRLRDKDGWSDWTELGVIGQDEGPDAGTDEYAGATRATEPVLGAGSVEIELRVPDGESVGVVLVDGGASGRSSGSAASATTVAPPILSRSEWGADPGLMNCTPQPSPGYRGAVVHHTVNANEYTASQAPALVRSIYAYHTATLGWCDIGYQFLVDRFGTAYEGRSGSLERAVIGAQSGGFNTETFGVAIIGTFTSTAPSTDSVASVRSIIDWQLALSGVDPRGTSEFTSAGNSKFPAGANVQLPNVMGHRDNGNTVCPGDGLYALLPSFRTAPTTSVQGTADAYTAGTKPVGQLTNTWGRVHGGAGATVWTEVMIAGAWSRSQTRTADEAGYFVIPLTYGSHTAGTYSWRVRAQLPDGVVTSPQFTLQRTGFTAFSAGTKPVGQLTNAWGRVHSGAEATVWTEVMVNGAWSRSQTRTADATGYFVIPLTYGATTPGTYSWRVRAQLPDGTVTSPQFTLQRTG